MTSISEIQAQKLGYSLRNHSSLDLTEIERHVPAALRERLLATVMWTNVLFNYGPFERHAEIIAGCINAIMLDDDAQHRREKSNV